MWFRQSRLADLDHTYVWAAFDRKASGHVGNVSIRIICRDVYQLGDIGYRVFNRHWGKGYGKEMLRAGILAGLMDLNLNRLEAYIDPDNKRYIALVKSLGLYRDGLRKHCYFQGGKWDDQVIYSVTRAQLKLPKLDPKIVRP